MKYLKGIFESSDSKEDIKDFVEGCFAYLLDDGFGIQVRELAYIGGTGAIKRSFSNERMIYLYKNDDGFTWDEVKDYYIPFIKILNNKYKLGVLRTVSFKYNQGMDIFSYKQIVEDDLFIASDISSLIKRWL